MRHMLALLLTTLLAAAPAAAQPFSQNSQGLVYNAFTPTGWATLSVTSATGRVALGSAGAANTPFVAWVQNTGANAANVVLGKDNTVVATLTSGTYVAAGQCVALNALGATYLAALTTSSTTTLNIMTGTGVPSACGGSGAGGGGSNATIVSPLGPSTAAAASVAMVFGTGATLPATTAVAPVVSAAAESNHVLKASAGSLLSVSTTTGASSGFMLIFDATSAPVDGAVTPKYCVPVAANNFASATWPTPATFATGITVVFSTTGCFTKTASATAFITGQVQ